MIDFTIERSEDFVTYHKGRPTNARQIPLEERRFIAWDGEGINLDGPGKPQSYVLFGCSTGEKIVERQNISTFKLMDFALEIGEAQVGAIHVGFSFNYDANMIVRTLHEKTLEILHKTGAVSLRRPNGVRYRIEYRPNKWFQITRFKEKYSRDHNPSAKTTVRIYDIWGFFTCSFIKAYETWVERPIPDEITKGKAGRPSFTLEQLDNGMVEKYWGIEIKMMQELAEELRKRLYGAGLRISQWHGPGALANYKLKMHGIKGHMKEAPEGVREAARYAYAGGRFERFSLGRHQDGPIFSMDINSAYPHAIRMLPSLSAGRWVRKSGAEIMGRHSLNKFGVYRVRLRFANKLSIMRPEPSPLFHRDLMGNMAYPWQTNGWYWYPEVIQVLRHLPRHLYEIDEGWELETEGEIVYPFDWVTDVYQTRREWKAKGYSSQLALKLLLNSLYGKLAQRVGWDEEKRKGPQYHQLEWAGWVTSYCRAMLWDVMRRIPFRDLIAVETDGIYTKTDPATLGITNSKELGGWEVDQYDEILYVQSGLAWIRKGNNWECKRRGLDATTFELEDCRNYLSSLAPREIWPPYRGETTRFVGLGAALASSAPTKARLGVWETKEREISPGLTGKRVHIHSMCKACQEGKTAYEAGHDMLIKPILNPDSHPHDIPWETDFTEYPWRAIDAEMKGLHAYHG
jgi:hypothetical protein